MTIMVRSFLVEGYVGVERVRAVYADGLLAADTTLVQRADLALLVDEAFGDLSPVDVARRLLLFAKALDHVSRVRYDLGLQHPALHHTAPGGG